MRIHQLHSWEVTVAEAKLIQLQLRDRVVMEDQPEPVRHVAGVDVGFDKGRALTRAAVVVLAFPSLERVDSQQVEIPTTFPYVPGYLSFREIPAICKALERVSIEPDLLLCDGQGYAHPRRFGLACHLGVITGKASLGVGKSRLIGTHTAVPAARGKWTELRDKDEVVGAVLRTRRKVKPVFVSVGHRLTLQSAVDYVMRCTTRYRLPETTRQADRLASKSPYTVTVDEARVDVTEQIRRAQFEDCERLSQLAIDSKAFWGYSDEFMAACRQELSVEPDDLDKPIYLLERGDEVVGFYSLYPLSSERVDLGHLFVDPAAIGSGYGRCLLEHAYTTARELGYRVLEIQGDPHAADFYAHCGARRVGSSPSVSIPGRELPLFEVDL